jgi:hypothetical protein
MLLWKDCTQEEHRLAEIMYLLFKSYPALEKFLFQSRVPRLNEPPDVLLNQAGCFSSGEQILIRVALDLWSGEGGTKLSDIIHRLDDNNFTNVMAGIVYCRLPQLDPTARAHIRSMIYDQ